MKSLIKSDADRILGQLRTGKERVALRLNVRSLEGYHFPVFVADLMYVTDPDKPGFDSASFYMNSVGDKHHYRDLQMVVELPVKPLADCRPDYNFAHNIAHSVSLEDADVMVRTLRPIMRKIKKLEQEGAGGHCLEDHVARFAEALNVKSYFCPDGSGCVERVDDLSSLKDSVSVLINGVLSQAAESHHRAA